MDRKFVPTSKVQRRLFGLPVCLSSLKKRKKKKKKGQSRFFVLFHPDSYPNFYRFLNHKFLMMSFHFGSQWRYNGELSIKGWNYSPSFFSLYMKLWGKSFQKLKREHLWGNILVIWESDELFLPSIKRYAQELQHSL